MECFKKFSVELMCYIAWLLGILTVLSGFRYLLLMSEATGKFYECRNSRSIHLFGVIGTRYGRVLIKRIFDGTTCAIANEQCGFRIDREYIGQMFSVMQVSMCMWKR